MRAAVLESPGDVRIRERDEPEPGPGEALVALEGSGVCGTDVSIFRGKIPVELPRVMGHELVGRVVGLGPSPGRPLEQGTRVLVDPALSCGACFWCLGERQNLCPHGALVGRDRDGGFTELLAVPARNLHPVPEQVPSDVAPLVQVLTTCLHAQRQVDLFPGDSVCVVGLGVTGLLHVQLARARGARTVIGITRSAEKRALAERLGADLALDPADPDLVERLREATDGRGPDLVVESAGKVATLAQAVELSRIGGRVLAYGTLTEREGEMPWYELYYKELAIVAARAARPRDFPASLELVARGEVELAPIVSHWLPLEELGRALELSGTPGALKVMLKHD